jgi:hypothetical protein
MSKKSNGNLAAAQISVFYGAPGTCENLRKSGNPMGVEHLPSYLNPPSREELLRRITDNWTVPQKAEVIPVDKALGRIPAADIFSKITLPAVRSSAGDGIAVRSARFSKGIPDTSSWILGWDFVRANTGEDFEDAYDAVIMIEDVDVSEDGRLKIHETSQPSPAHERTAGRQHRERGRPSGAVAPSPPAKRFGGFADGRRQGHSGA